ncbi:MAG: hypothetical protein R3B84_01555 [Zavarzinella sp.]
MTNKEKKSGKLITRTDSEPIIVVNCANWPDSGDPERTTGKFVTNTPSEPITLVDCSNWVLDRPYIKLTFTRNESASPAQLQTRIEQVMLALHDLRPELELKYDQDRSEIVDIDGTQTAIVALTPQADLPDLAEKLRDLFQEVRKTLFSQDPDDSQQISEECELVAMDLNS